MAVAIHIIFKNNNISDMYIKITTTLCRASN